MGSLKIMHANVNGLGARKTELGLYLTESTPDIVCLNETKINGRPHPRFCGYTLASHRDRAVTSDKHNGGGVAIYVRSNIAHDDVSPGVDDVTAIKIKIGNVEFVIISYYCPPRPECKIDIKTLSGFVSQHENVIIMGDLNAKHSSMARAHQTAEATPCLTLSREMI